MYIKLAWRNIWKNKRRTVITAASICFAVVLALFMRSMQLGSYEHMIKNAVKLYTGHIQIQGKGYWDEKSINKSFIYKDNIPVFLRSIKKITAFASRLESFALISCGELTKGSFIVGIEPGPENRLTGLKKRLIQGQYLNAEDKAVLISEGLAKYLKVEAGSEIVILGQGFHGMSAAGKYKVSGIVKFPAPDLNKRLVFLPLKEAQWLYSAENRVTSIAVIVNKHSQQEEVTGILKKKFSNNYDILEWEEMLPEIVQLIEVDNAGGIITLSILYIIIGFGILGVVMMMIMERRYEFGVLTAIGMKRRQLCLTTFLETVFISFTGVLAGIIISVPLLIVMYYNPIHMTGKAAEGMLKYGFEPLLPFLLSPGIFINHALIILLIAVIALVYPLYTILRFDIIKAMRS